jgi:hypothetical protein
MQAADVYADNRKRGSQPPQVMNASFDYVDSSVL